MTAAVVIEPCESLTVKRKRRELMEYLVGVVLGLIVGGFATLSGFDRDRAFYPTVLIVIASYYSLFAVMGTPRNPPLFIVIVAGIVLSAIALFAVNVIMCSVVCGIVGHAVFDFCIRPAVVTNRGVPRWW